MKTPAEKQTVFENDEGTSAVEFALLAPVFMIIVFGIMNLGMAFYSGFTVQWAIERSSRQLFIDETMTAADLQAIVDERLARIGVDLNVVVGMTTEAGTQTDVAVITSDYIYALEPPLLDPIPITFTTRTLVPRPKSS